MTLYGAAVLETAVSDDEGGTWGGSSDMLCASPKEHGDLERGVLSAPLCAASQEAVVRTLQRNLKPID
jgi:hypothetical protein